MNLPSTKGKAAEEKDPLVKILKAYPILIPTAMGQAATIIWGLGDDNKMYQWDSQQRKWILP